MVKKCIRCSGDANYGSMGNLTMGYPYPVWICRNCHAEWLVYYDVHDIGKYMVNKFDNSAWKEYFERFVGKKLSKVWRIA